MTTRVRLNTQPERKRLQLNEDRPARPKLVDDSPPTKGRYFDDPDDMSKLRGFSTGCRVFDCALTGPSAKGWILGRVSNVVGDRSSGKTLIAIEAMANFSRKFRDPKKHLIRYYEVEDAFDEAYAATLGMPLDRVNRGGQNADTVGDFEKDLMQWLEKVPADGCGLYILDSLDALAADDEVEVKMKTKKQKTEDGEEVEVTTSQEKGSYGTAKAKKMSQMFRRLVRKIGRKNVHLMIISQLRDKIGVTFGERHTRAGGRALDFYASHIVWLANLGKIQMERKKVKRPIGVAVRINVKKNKVALPFRTVDYPILFAYGIDDYRAGLDWLQEVGRYDEARVTGSPAEAAKAFHRLNHEDASQERKRINKIVSRVWGEVESMFMPQRGKYE